MKTIIAGSRSIEDSSSVYRAFHDCPFSKKVTEIVSGNCRGPDKSGEELAKEYNIPLKIFPANWAKYKQGAGKIRNVEMALYADALIAVWDGFSSGTAHMIDCARARGLQVYVHLE